jgi:hypothetical protein
MGETSMEAESVVLLLLSEMVTSMNLGMFRAKERAVTGMM